MVLDFLTTVELTHLLPDSNMQRRAKVEEETTFTGVYMCLDTSKDWLSLQDAYALHHGIDLQVMDVSFQTPFTLVIPGGTLWGGG